MCNAVQFFYFIRLTQYPTKHTKAMITINEISLRHEACAFQSQISQYQSLFIDYILPNLRKQCNRDSIVQTKYPARSQ